MNQHSISNAIRAHALSLGFDLVGFAPILPPAHALFFRKWLEQGFHGEMAYLARTADARCDPQQVLPGAKSAVVVGLNYAPAVSPGTDDPSRGVFARYALGEDYHPVMEQKLGQLLQFIRQHYPECRAKIYVDAGPVLERDLAWRAGLGWFGKNTMLINTYRGSYFLLGEILLDVELEYDHPAFGGCGKCNRCIEACPTGAIVAPYVLDARRCISYLTIELRGSIPEEMRSKMGNRIFGCDICQEVCPFNQPRPHAPLRSAPTAEPRFAPREVTLTPKLVDLLRMSEEEFRVAFRNSPVKRAKWRGFRRNVAVALGNSKNPEVLPVLQQELQRETDPTVHEHLQWAIERCR
ncbi:MAG: epoxyqueuosine reductase [Armatimonadota bacterium]|nr:MAG: epoxyqueuosine reductase [Armatimonadota bacterium]